MDDIGECDMKPYVDNGCVGQLHWLLSLDHAPQDPNRYTLQTSNVILSRVCVNYLSSKTTFKDWTICEKHKRQLLDNWRSQHHCCHHAHRFNTKNCTVMSTVTYAMSKTILRHEGMVLPIGGNICQACKSEYQERLIPGLTSLRDLDTPQIPSYVVKTEALENRISSTTTRPPQINSVTVADFSRGTGTVALAKPPAPQKCTARPVIQSRINTGNCKEISAPQSSIVTPAVQPKMAAVTIKPADIRNNTPASPAPVGLRLIKTASLASNQANISPALPREEREPSPQADNDRSTPSPPRSGRQTEDASRKVEGGKEGIVGEEYKLYCHLCHIGFLKESSYRHHMSNYQELHKKIQEREGEERCCEECNKKFSDDKEYRQHMHNEHRVDDDAFYCQICQIFLKNESAYRSHHSKLHLERRSRVFYCRECGEVFPCKQQHIHHIRSHWSGGDQCGHQCTACGKLFTSGNRSAYVKHLATHDEEDSQRPCECKDCSKQEDDSATSLTVSARPLTDKKRQPPSTYPAAASAIKRPRRQATLKKRKKASLWDQLEDNSLDSVEDVDDPSEEEIDDEEEDMEDEEEEEEEELEVKCGVCGESFQSVVSLQRHVERKHHVEEEDDGDSDYTPEQEVSSPPPIEPWKCSLCSQVCKSYRSFKMHRTKCSVVRVAAPLEQPSPGKSRSRPPRTADLISLMRQEFTTALPGEEEDEEGQERLYPLSSSKQGGRLQPGTPRVISDSSRATRKRLEHLTLLAQQLMREKEERRVEKRRAEELQDNTANIDDADSDEDSLDAGINNKDDLLIPLSNGWVCEKRRDGSAPGGYLTTYWSPEGENFHTKFEIEEHVRVKNLDLDLTAFEVVEGGGQTRQTTNQNKVKRVRVKDDETGLPMVIIFPEGRGCLTMDVSATV